MKNLHKILFDMSVEEKALLVNLLRREIFPKTPLASCTVAGMSESYNKNTNMILDSLIWNLYGLHYKDYLEVIGPGNYYIGICHFKMEVALDRSIKYYMEQLSEKGIENNFLPEVELGT